MPGLWLSTCYSLTPIPILLPSTPFVSYSEETETNNWNVPAVPTLQLSWPAFSSSTPPLTSLSDLQKRRLGSPRYQLGDARGRLNSVRESKPLQISPMILLLAQWFNTAQPFCSSHTKSFCWNHPTFFLWLNTSRQWSVDWQDCGFLPSASICYSHLPQSLTRELSFGSVEIACLERYKNQVIVSSTVKSSRIFCQPEPAGNGSRIKAAHILTYLLHPPTSFSRYAALFKYLSVHVLILSVPWLFMLWQSHEGSEPQCLPSKWEYPVALSFS